MSINFYLHIEVWKNVEIPQINFNLSWHPSQKYREWEWRGDEVLYWGNSVLKETEGTHFAYLNVQVYSYHFANYFTCANHTDHTTELTMKFFKKMNIYWLFFFNFRSHNKFFLIGRKSKNTKKYRERSEKYDVIPWYSINKQQNDSTSYMSNYYNYKAISNESW